MVRRLLAAALALCAMVGPAVAQELAATTQPNQVTITWPGGMMKLSAVRGVARYNEGQPARAIPAMPDLAAIVNGQAVEIRLANPPKTKVITAVYEIHAEISGPGWADPTGENTWIRRRQWIPVSQAAKEIIAARNAGKTPSTQPASAPSTLGRFAWAPATGMWRYLHKSCGNDGASDAWMGFLSPYIPDRSLLLADEGIILRCGPDDTVAALSAIPALGLAYEDASRLSIGPRVDGLQPDTPNRLLLRVFVGKGKPAELGAKWVDATEAQPLRVFFSGDSVGAENGYTSVLARHLGKEFPGKVRSVNISCGGFTTANALAGFKADVLDSRGNFVVFQLCYNDVGKIKPPDVVANFRKMIDPLIAQPGGRAVVLTPLSYDKKRVDDTLKRGGDINKVHTEQYIPALEKMVADYEADPKTKGKVAFVNIWQAMAKVRAEKGADYVLLPDGSHPNKEGHQLIGDTAWPEVKRLAADALKELTPSDGRQP